MASNPFEFGGAWRRTEKGNNDDYYGGGNEAFVNKAAAYAYIPNVVRPGKTFGVFESGKVVEYWWPSASATADGQEELKNSNPGGSVDLSGYATTIQVASDIGTAINALKNGVAVDGDTLAKLRGLISTLATSVSGNASQIAAINTLLTSNDVSLDTLQEIVAYIKDNKSSIDNLLSGKLNKSDKASESEANAQTDDSKFITSFRLGTWLLSVLARALTITGLWKFTQRPKVTVGGVDKGVIVEGEAIVLTAEQAEALINGTLSVITVNKALDGTITYTAGIGLLDQLAPSAVDAYLTDTAAWGNVSGQNSDYLQIFGNNQTGLLGTTNQFRIINSIWHFCESHIVGTTTSNGSATWVRNKSIDVEFSSAVRTDVATDTGWTLDRKVSTVKTKVGCWFSGIDGYSYFCYGDNGNNPTAWYWVRIGRPQSINVDITDATLQAEIQGEDFKQSQILLPTSTIKGEDMQRHYWEIDGKPNVAGAIYSGGIIKWIKYMLEGDAAPVAGNAILNGVFPETFVTYTPVLNLAQYKITATIKVISLTASAFSVTVTYTDEDGISTIMPLSSQLQEQVGSGRYLIPNVSIAALNTADISIDVSPIGGGTVTANVSAFIWLEQDLSDLI